MKKILASFTVVIYFVFACGVMVNYHFCMDRYTSFGLYQPSGSSCQSCGMHTKKQRCCHDEVRIVRLQNDYQTAAAFFSLKNIQPAPGLFRFVLSENLLKEQILTHKIDQSPPPLNQQDQYLQNCVFRI